jgi:hypothetical protein
MTLSVNPPKVCVRCKVNKPNRPRGLCWHCYYTPGVRERYGPTDERKAGRNVRSGYRRRSQRDRTECEQAREPRGTAHGFARDIARTY